MTDDRHVTDDECGRIVRASLDPGRVLGGPDGHDGGEPDVLLVEVEAIVRRHRAEALREHRRRVARFMPSGLVNRATVLADLDDYADRIEEGEQ